MLTPVRVTVVLGSRAITELIIKVASSNTLIRIHFFYLFYSKSQNLYSIYNALPLIYYFRVGFCEKYFLDGQENEMFFCFIFNYVLVEYYLDI